MPINAEWHAAHPMPKNPTDAERIAWHLEHQEHCACRKIPDGVLKLIEKARHRDEPSAPS